MFPRVAVWILLATAGCSISPGGDVDAGTGSDAGANVCASGWGCIAPDGCIGGVCSRGCTSNTDCGALVCEGGDCVLCQTHGQCMSFEACISGACGRGCRSSADCDGVCREGVCEPCAVDTDCPDGFCAAGRCKNCVGDADCSVEQECGANGRCVARFECTWGGTQCAVRSGDAYFCNPGTNWCELGCTTACTGPLPDCNPCPAGEQCRFGWRCWPDPCPGCGPTGSPCDIDPDCTSGLCQNITENDPLCRGGNACTVSCTTDAECVMAAQAARAFYPDRATCVADECDLVATWLGEPGTVCE